VSWPLIEPVASSAWAGVTATANVAVHATAKTPNRRSALRMVDLRGPRVFLPAESSREQAGRQQDSARIENGVSRRKSLVAGRIEPS
jgi:hypothetical protein